MSLQAKDSVTKHFERDHHRITVSVGRFDTNTWIAHRVKVRAPDGTDFPPFSLAITACKSKEEAFENGLNQ